MPGLFAAGECAVQQFFAGIFGRDITIVDALLPSDKLTAQDRLNLYRGSIFGL